MLRDGYCKFEDQCWFSHDAAALEAAKKKSCSKTPCKLFQEGNCQKGDKCEYAHNRPQNGTEDAGTSTVAISCIAQPLGDARAERPIARHCSSDPIGPKACEVNDIVARHCSSDPIDESAKTPSNRTSSDNVLSNDRCHSGFIAEIMREQEKARVMRDQLQAVLAVEETERAEAAKQMLREQQQVTQPHAKKKKKKKRKRNRRN